MAETKKMMSLEQLLEKKSGRDKRKDETKDIYIKSTDAYLRFNMPSDSAVLEYYDVAKEGSIADIAKAYSRLIYDYCPALRNKKLLDGAGVEYPYDIVGAMFDSDEILDIGKELVAFHEGKDVSDDDEEGLKN